MLMQNLGWQTKSIMVCYGFFWSVQKKWGWRWPCFGWNPYCFWNVNHALLYFCLLLSLLLYYFVFMFLGILMRFLSKEGHCLPRSHSKARFLSTPYSNVFHQTSPVLVRTRRVWNLGNVYSLFSPNLSNIECFRMTSRRPYWCPKTMKRPPCWCPKPILWELNSFLM